MVAPSIPSNQTTIKITIHVAFTFHKLSKPTPNRGWCGVKEYLTFHHYDGPWRGYHASAMHTYPTASVKPFQLFEWAIKEWW